MMTMKAWAVGCVLVATLGCGGNRSPAAPSGPVDQRLTLAPAETVNVPGAGISVQFVSVSGDSRCPADANCIQGGDAIVIIRVRELNDTAALYDLHTGDSRRAAATHRNLRVELVELQPYPFSSRPVTPDQYRVTLRVTR